MNNSKSLTTEETFNLAAKNHQEGKTDIAQKLYLQVLRIKPNHSQAHNNLGVIFNQLREFKKAKDCFEKAIEIDPNYADAHYNLGVLLKELGEHQKAIDCYEKAIKINPNYANAHNNLGIIFKELGEHQKAKACCEKAIEINPNYVNAHYNLGVIFYELGENQKAIDCYEKAIKLDLNYIDAHNNLGNVFKKLGEHQKAIDCYEKAIEINPNYADAHNNLGVIFYELGENQKAKNCYEKAIEINPNYADALNNLGVILQGLGENQKAIECCEKAIEINPNDINSINNLAIIFRELKEYKKAKQYCEKAIEINSNNTNTLNILGIIFKDIGEIEKAINCHEKAISIDRNSIVSISNLATLFQQFKFDNQIKDNKIKYKKLILLLLKSNKIDYKKIFNNARSALLVDIDCNKVKKIINLKSLLSNEIIGKLLNEELLYLILQKSLIIDVFLEKLLTKLRCEILSTLYNSNKDILKEHFIFIISLAEQSWLNEYVYAQSEKEIDYINKLKNKVENSIEVDELEIAILGCYTPLNSSKIITEKLSNYKSTNILFNDLIDVQIKEPLKEIELKKSINSLDKIIDPVSIKVQEQYEEHPYPRWRYTDKYIPSHFLLSINDEIKPNRVAYNSQFNNPNVLIAGCGTGNHSISATRYKNANILAVDLSLSSLAYAKRKTEELGFKSIEYIHADILQLNKLNRKFDIIESSGVLHHMEDPIAGLKVLLDILEPHGFLKLGLYSESGWQNVVKTKEFINKKNFKNTSEDIRICRQEIINEKKNPSFQAITFSSDFYSTSNVRDLLFHVQVHLFTIPQISQILKNLNLEFLGFLNRDPLIIKKKIKLFPEDKNNISLDNWHQFEINNPDTFAGMYQFWVRKI